MHTDDVPGVTGAKEVLLKRGIPGVYFLGMCIHPAISARVPAILELHRLIREQKDAIVEISMVSPTVITSWGTRAAHAAEVRQVFPRDHENANPHRFWRFPQGVIRPR